MPDFETWIKENSVQTKNSILQKEPNGFIDRADSVLSFVEGTRTLSIAPTGSGYGIFSFGNQIEKSATETFTINNVSGSHYIYFDDDGVLRSSVSFDPALVFGPACFVAVIPWNAPDGNLPFSDFQDERHGLMDSRTHARLHTDDGTVVKRMNLITFDDTQDGSSLACAQFGVNSGTITDEDISLTVSAKASTTTGLVSCLDGASEWKRCSPVANTSLVITGSGRLAYNLNTSGNFSLAEVPNGHYVSYYVIGTTANTDANRVFVVPGQEVYSSKSEAIVAQIEEAARFVSASATTTQLKMAEYKVLGAVLLRTDDSYTNAVKSVIVDIGGGRNYNDFRESRLNNAYSSGSGLVIPTTLSRDVDADGILSTSDMELNVNTVNGKVIITVPDISGLDRRDITWKVRKESDDTNQAIILLETASDSSYGATIHAFVLDYVGDCFCISITEAGKYTINHFTSAYDYVSIPSVATLTPELVSTTLSAFGDLVEIGGEASVLAQFRYREVGELTWIISTGANLTVEGTFDEDITVTAGLTYEVQAIITDSASTIFYGDVKQTTGNYYSSVAAARADGLERCWNLQEASGTDTTGVDEMGSGENMVCSGGVTIGSETINSNTVYRRIFGSSDEMEAPFRFDNTAGGQRFSIFLQLDARSISGDHTIFSTGANKISLATDGDDFQLEVNGSVSSWTNQTPTGKINLLITSNRGNTRTRMYVITTTGATEVLTLTRVYNGTFDYLRIADGTSGDGNHQHGEYLNDGDIWCIAFWNRFFGSGEAIDLVKALETDGMQVV